jgi:hypothetical protein
MAVRRYRGFSLLYDRKLFSKRKKKIHEERMAMINKIRVTILKGRFCFA